MLNFNCVTKFAEWKKNQNGSRETKSSNDEKIEQHRSDDQPRSTTVTSGSNPVKKTTVSRNLFQNDLDEKNKVAEKKDEKTERDDGEEKKPYSCQHCEKIFECQDFFEEHEAVCFKRPVQNLQLNFMNSINLFAKSQPVASCSASNSLLHIDVTALETLKRTRGRRRRRSKSPKDDGGKKKLLDMFKNKNNHIPMTSPLGKRLLKQFGQKVEHRYPPVYEKYCKPKSGFPISEKEYPIDTKRAILKHGDNPHTHIYTRGRRQRIDRWTEFVVRLNKASWKHLNSCKDPEIEIEKLHPRMKSIVFPPGATDSSYLERKWRAAIEFPQIRLVDFKKNMDVLCPPGKKDSSPKPGTSKSTV